MGGGKELDEAQKQAAERICFESVNRRLEKIKKKGERRNYKRNYKRMVGESKGGREKAQYRER